MSTVYLGLGSNLGDRQRNLQRAIEELNSSGVRVQKISSFIETDPFECPGKHTYLNAVLKAETHLLPDDLLDIIHNIQNKFGRRRKIFRGPRLMDIDILLYDDLKLVTRRLIVPHPRMIQREFILQSLQEIEPRLCASLKT